jgi:hypothetical protein
MVITKFNLYESNTGKFDFDEYIITYDTFEEALYFIEQMKKKNYDFYGLDSIVDDIKYWSCFIYKSDQSDSKLFILAKRKYFELKGYNKITVEEAIKLADTQNQNNNPPMIKWYKKGKLEKDGNN